MLQLWRGWPYYAIEIRPTLLSGQKCLLRSISRLSSFSSNSAGQLDILGHDGDALGVDGAEIGVFKQTNEVSFGGLLESKDSLQQRAELQAS